VTLPAEHSRELGTSAQAAPWYVCSPVSGEQSLVVPIWSRQSVGDVSASAHSSPITSLRNETITIQRFWREVTARRTLTARTCLGKRLLELRDKYRASGERLLDWDDVAREIQERRGEQNKGDID
jgi:hypothetical protein